MALQDFKQVIGRAVTDEAFRKQLLADPKNALAGYHLTPEERSHLSLLNEHQFAMLGRSLSTANQVSEVHVRAYDPEAKKQIIGASTPDPHPRRDGSIEPGEFDRKEAARKNFTDALISEPAKLPPRLLAASGLLLVLTLLVVYILVSGGYLASHDPCAPENQTATAIALLGPAPAEKAHFQEVGGLSVSTSPCDFKEGGLSSPPAGITPVPPSATPIPAVDTGAAQGEVTTPPACVPDAGDGLCSACENTDLDSASCVCVIDGVCGPQEGLNCPDCAPTDAGGGGNGGKSCSCQCTPNGCFNRCTQKKCAP